MGKKMQFDSDHPYPYLKTIKYGARFLIQTMMTMGNPSLAMHMTTMMPMGNPSLAMHMTGASFLSSPTLIV